MTKSRAESSDSSVSSTTGKPSVSHSSVSAKRVKGLIRVVETEVLELMDVELVEGKGEEGEGDDDAEDGDENGVVEVLPITLVTVFVVATMAGIWPAGSLSRGEAYMKVPEGI